MTFRESFDKLCGKIGDTLLTVFVFPFVLIAWAVMLVLTAISMKVKDGECDE